ncbi:MAG: dienelactone hydrolase family protein [Acidobacteriota bacterium]|nr:dienelactone hydrolase family protein [Acidobacteriota bacterium]
MKLAPPESPFDVFRRSLVSTVALPALILGLVLALVAVGCAAPTNEPVEGGEEDTEASYEDRMATEHADDTAEPSPAAQQEPAMPVDEEEVTYAVLGDREIQGFFAQPQEVQGDVPGILVIHEWWGLNDNIRNMARRLAGEGYMALAVDLYGGESADTPEAARELMQGTTERTDELEENLRQAQDFLVRQGAVRSGVIGWCFGGGWSLRTGLLMPDQIQAVVIYYGRLITDPDELAALQAPVLGIFGEEDQGIPVESVQEFETALEDLGKDNAIAIFPGADHAFANPSGERYQPEAAEKAWDLTQDFLRRHLQPGAPD